MMADLDFSDLEDLNGWFVSKEDKNCFFSTSMVERGDLVLSTKEADYIVDVKEDITPFELWQLLHWKETVAMNFAYNQDRIVRQLINKAVDLKIIRHIRIEKTESQ